MFLAFIANTFFIEKEVFAIFNTKAYKTDFTA